MVLLIRAMALSLAAALVFGQAHAQTSGTMSVQLEVLPPALSVTVASAQMDFGQQRANAGHVVLDPSNGLISTKAAGMHALGEVQLRGPARTAYIVSVSHESQLKNVEADHELDFELQWARSENCADLAYQVLGSVRNTEGSLGPDGCAALRFGGSIALWNAVEGRYAGQLSVRVFPL